MHRSWMILGLGALALILLVVGASAIWYERPTVLTVAVSRADRDDLNLMVAAESELKRSRRTVRLRILQTDNAADAAAQVDHGKAELAVVRTDIALPTTGQTVVILHKDAAIIVAPASSDVQALSDLAGHTIGIVGDGPGNNRLLETALAQNDVRLDQVKIVPLDLADVAEAVRAKRVDAVMVVDVVSSPKVRDIVTTVMAAGQGAPVFLSVAEADAIAQRSPSYESLEVVRGAFGGSPPRPAEEFDTLSVTHRLVASEAVAEGPVADLTRFLLSERMGLDSAVPIARRIEAPSTDKGVALPVHAGAAAYIDDEEETFFDKYSDFIYIGAMLVGVLASGVTALMSRMNSRRAAALDVSVDRMVEMLQAARAVRTLRELDQLQAEADGHLEAALKSFAALGDEARLRVFGLALDQVRAAIHDRRRELAGGVPPAWAANDLGPNPAATAT